MAKRHWIYVSLLGDILIINFLTYFSFYLRFGGSIPEFNFSAYTSLAIPATLSYIIFFYIYDLYSPEYLQSSWEVLSRLFVAMSVGLLVSVSLSFFLRLFSFPRLVIFMSWTSMLLSVFAWRMVSLRIFTIKWPLKRVLIIGSGNIVSEIISSLKKRPWGSRVVGIARAYKGVSPYSGAEEDYEVLGDINDIPRIIEDHDINQIIITSPAHHRELVEKIVQADRDNIKIDVVPEFYEIYLGRMEHTLISDIPLLAITREPVKPWVIRFKRIFDVSLSLLILTITLPFLLIISLLIKLSSKGPVFYTQTRVGQHGRAFVILKFRTMKLKAEELTGPILATKNDPRITAIGRFLRRWRIDELPQLTNVLRGDMSFVGPRPERPEFVNEYLEKIPGYNKRLDIKPGITGLAQISGRYTTSTENKLKYDLIYICHQSFLLDLKIILQTIRVALEGSGF